MSDKYQFYSKERLYFVTFTIEFWIDLFTRKEYSLIIIESLQYCQQHKGLEIYAYCIMPSHMHMIIAAKKGFDLSNTVRDFKKFTSKKLINSIKAIEESRRDWLLDKFSFAGRNKNRIQQYKVWQDGSHAKVLQSNDFMMQKLEYIHNNPVAAMIVDSPENYVFSSAKTYIEENRGYIKLDGFVE